MRISDWSSDVCSSDLAAAGRRWVWRLRRSPSRSSYAPSETSATAGSPGCRRSGGPRLCGPLPTSVGGPSPSVAATVALLVAAFGVASLRDLGSGLIAERPGPAGAPASRSNPLGLALRLQRGPRGGWAIRFFLTGIVYGRSEEHTAE